MLYGLIAVVAALLIFIVVSYFLSCKTYSLNFEDNEIKVENKAAHLKIYINGTLCEDFYMPQLIKGEEYKLQVAGKEAVLKCQTSSLGYKMRVELFVDEKLVADNGVILKNKKQDKKDNDDDINGKVVFDSNSEVINEEENSDN